MLPKHDYMIVGSGLAGSVLTNLLSNRGKTVLVVESRKNVGGNIVEKIMDGIPVHQYGPHIFHTDNEIIWDLVNKYTEFDTTYIHSPIAISDGIQYNLPLNMNTFSKIFNVYKVSDVAKAIMNEINTCKFDYKNPKNLEEKAISMIGTTVYQKLIRDYTEKQWNKKCTDLPPDIIARIPFRLTYNNRYFNDRFQGMPVCKNEKGGYQILIENLLYQNKHRVDVLTNWKIENIQQLKAVKERYSCDKVIYTGRIDTLFGIDALEFRSCDFIHEKIKMSNMYGNSVINICDKSKDATRIIEHKNFYQRNHEILSKPYTYVTYEYPCEPDSDSEPLYPINDKRNQEVYEKFKAMAERENIILCGRLAEYKYYDMDDVILSAMDCYEKLPL